MSGAAVRHATTDGPAGLHSKPHEPPAGSVTLIIMGYGGGAAIRERADQAGCDPLLLSAIARASRLGLPAPLDLGNARGYW